MPKKQAEAVLVDIIDLLITRLQAGVGRAIMVAA
jgi:hypothetical protein